MSKSNVIPNLGACLWFLSMWKTNLFQSFNFVDDFLKFYFYIST